MRTFVHFSHLVEAMVEESLSHWSFVWSMELVHVSGFCSVVAKKGLTISGSNTV